MTRLAILLLPLALGACAGSGARPSGEKNCDATKVAGFEGRPADEAGVERVRRAAGAAIVRVVKPGMMVTMDYRPERVTVEVDEQGRITRIACG